MKMKRIIASIFVRDGIAVQSIGFNTFLPVGKPEVLAEFFSQWGADEVVLIDISGTKNNCTISLDLVEKVASRCFVPLAVGGGLRTREDISQMLKKGADKVLVNSIIQNNFSLLEEFAAEFGAQCVIASVDYQFNATSNQYEVYSHAKKQTIGKNLFDYVEKLSKTSIGEILLQNVERDGLLTGFDIETFQRIGMNATLPIIAMSGAGESSHFKELFEKTTMTSAAAGNMFAYIEHSITLLKANLKKYGVDGIRLNEAHAYLDHTFKNDRLRAPSENCLENLLFQKLEKEII